ncbi:estrogen sulfotransferase, testis isoform-like [Centruroides sculpturatus]|uniref:estrogen sulfotransferase, testis isoform-like n=1 Tax=Centruroides sculpturatus TaxID=218467 RepID=UPI000C6CA661|nr:estrogen sulfotransferase, testis isoform-like [Centruroides sculpturatus]
MESNFCVNVKGVPMPKAFPEKAVRSALNYKAKPGEIYIVTYPKCGTTWMHNIVLLILRKGKVSEDPLDFFLGCPFLEMMGADYVEESKAKVMKTHIPYYAIPYSDEAKYIYVARNPKDCCVSYYYHMKLLLPKDIDLNFDKFFDGFLEGSIGYGHYFDHLLEWYQHRNDKNVHFVTYENLKKDIRGEIMKIAKFIGEEYEKSILEDPTVLENIVYYSSFEYMKKDTNRVMELFLNGDEIFKNRDLPDALVEMMKSTSENRENRGSGNFVRKGIVGDWKNHFNENQIKLLDEKTAEKTKNSDVMNLWKDI